MTLRLDVGIQAENFRLKDGEGREVALEDYRGRDNVLLLFFLGGFDLFAMRGLRELARMYSDIKSLDTEVLAITPELQGKVKTLTDNLKPPFRVLSDPELKTVKMYDVYDPMKNWTWPAAFIIDRNGIVQYSFRGASPPNTPELQYIISKLRQMKEGKSEGQAAQQSAAAAKKK